MKKLFVFLFILSSIAIAQNKAEQKEYSPYYKHKKSMFESLPNTPGEIIFLGNSITDGCNWTELFSDLRVKNRGISGDVTEGILNRLDEVTESNPAKIFIMIGINDLARNKSKQEILDNCEIIVDQILTDSPETEIYLQSILPVSKKYGRFEKHYSKSDSIVSLNKGLESLAKKKGQIYVDLYLSFIDNENNLKDEFTEDGLHLNGKAYKVWKSLIDKYISKD